MSRSNVLRRPRATAVVIRRGTPTDADALFELISAHQTEGHLLPRERGELRRRATRFVVATSGREMIACAELAILSPRTAEVRSLVVRSDARGKGVAGRLVDALRDQAITEGFQALSAFSHDARFFIKHDFSIVPHLWVPEKIARDCAECPLFRRCGQQAMLLPLKETVSHGADVVEDRRVRVA